MKVLINLTFALIIILGCNFVKAHQLSNDSLIPIICLDKEFNTPVEGVYIYKNNSFLGSTNENGRFYIRKEMFSSFDIIFLKHPFYEDLSVPINKLERFIFYLKSNSKMLESVEIVSIDRKKMLKRHKKKKWSEYMGLYKYQEEVYNNTNEILYTKNMIVVIKDDGGGQDGFLLNPAEDIEILANKVLSNKEDSTFYTVNINNTHESLIQKLRFYNYYRKSRGFFNKSKINKFIVNSYKDRDTLVMCFSEKDTIYGVTNLPKGSGVYKSIKDTILSLSLEFPLNILSDKGKELKIYRAKKFDEFLEYNLSETVQIDYKTFKKIPIPVHYFYTQNFLLIDKQDYELNEFRREISLSLIEVMDNSTEINPEKVNMFGFFSDEINASDNHILLE